MYCLTSTYTWRAPGWSVRILARIPPGKNTTHSAPTAMGARSIRQDTLHKGRKEGYSNSGNSCSTFSEWDEVRSKMPELVAFEEWNHGTYFFVQDRSWPPPDRAGYGRSAPWLLHCFFLRNTSLDDPYNSAAVSQNIHNHRVVSNPFFERTSNGGCRMPRTIKKMICLAPFRVRPCSGRAFRTPDSTTRRGW